MAAYPVVTKPSLKFTTTLLNTRETASQALVAKFGIASKSALYGSPMAITISGELDQLPLRDFVIDCEREFRVVLVKDTVEFMRQTGLELFESRLLEVPVPSDA